MDEKRELTPELDRTALSVVSLDDESDETAYWLTRTPEERLRQVERLRQINFGWRANEPIQKVLEVVDLLSHTGSRSMCKVIHGVNNFYSRRE